MDIVTYALAKKMMQSAVSGISKMTVNGTDLIIETNKGDKVTVSFPVPKDGVSVSNITLTDTNDLVFTMSDGETFSAPLSLPEVVEGDSAYEIACQEGFEGTKEEWLESLKGEQGEDGKSAYQIWLDEGNSGTEQDFINSLKGQEGNTPFINAEGYWQIGDTVTDVKAEGPKGDTGNSITITDIDQANKPGDDSVITFSDGSTLSVYNGPTGPQGPEGPVGPTGPAYTLTQTDIDTIVAQVIEDLPKYNGEYTEVTNNG